VRLKSALVLIFMIVLQPHGVLTSPDEACGVVVNVVDGDTFDVLIKKADPRAQNEIERVRLADVNAPLAKDLTVAILLNKSIWLDIDDRSDDGRGPYGRLICVVYLAGVDGLPIPSPCFNRILVSSSHAVVDDFETNEFNPEEWWPSEGNASETMPQKAKRYVGSKNSNVYHYPSCEWAQRIKPENEIWFSNIMEARARGYYPCRVCNPI